MAKAKLFKKPKKLKMSTKSEEALDESIAHWHSVKREYESCFRGDCALCDKYYSEDEEIYRCRGCPILIKTNKTNCKGTPYYEYNDNKEDVSESKRKRLAQDEIDFLQTCYY